MIGASRLDKTEILELAVDELRHCVTSSQTTPPCECTSLLTYYTYLLLSLGTRMQAVCGCNPQPRATQPPTVSEMVKLNEYGFSI